MGDCTFPSNGYCNVLGVCVSGGGRERGGDEGQGKDPRIPRRGTQSHYYSNYNRNASHCYLEPYS